MNIKLMTNVFRLKNSFYIALFISILFMIGFYLLSYFQLIQSVESQALIGEASRWCERVSSGVFREPINTLSNLGFMVVGLFILYKLSNENSFNNFSGLTSISVLYGICVIWLGPGSMLMHGTNTEWGGWADNLSMVMYIIIPWLYNCYKMSNWTESKLIKIYLLVVFIYAITRGLFGYGMGIGLDLFGVSIGLWVISEFLFKFWSPRMRFYSGFVGFIVLMIFGIFPQEVFNNFAEYWWIIFFWVPGLLATKKPDSVRSYRFYFLGMIAYLSAFAIWLTGVPGNESCNPDSLIQAHGIWHLLTALATILFFYHYRSERLIN